MVPFYISKTEISELNRNMVEVIREKAKMFGIEYGVVVINYDGGTCFDDVAIGGSAFYSFPLKVGCPQVLPPDSNDEGFTCDCLGVAIAKINAANHAWIASGRTALTSEECDESDNIMGRQNWPGCVIYPLTNGKTVCGKIMVAVSGGTSEQDSACAWAAYDVIKDISALKTTNPGTLL